MLWINKQNIVTRDAFRVWFWIGGITHIVCLPIMALLHDKGLRGYLEDMLECFDTSWID